MKFLKALLFLLVLPPVLLLAWFYLTSPVYRFIPPQPFSGNKIYNPYQEIDSTRWLAGNFQVQTRVWLGITNGRKNTSEAVWNAYRWMGYDIIAISDYQAINRVFEDSSGYIAVYEHGYGIHKTHQVCLGSRSVLWRDYPLGATLSQKQHIIDLLLNDNDLVALAHPDLRNGYRPEELKYLSGYHLMEVLNGARVSLAHWDTALSWGYPAFILADDDAHDISNPDEIGKYITFIAASSTETSEILRRLKQGSAYGVRVLTHQRGQGFIKRLPRLISCEVKDVDTLEVVFSDTAREIRFVGQGGKIRSIHRQTTLGAFPFGQQDTYLRVEAEFEGKAILYLNPVFRYQGGEIQLPKRASVDTQATLTLRVILWACLGIMSFIFLKIKKKQKHHGRA
ncbi:MAG: hypothetical protein ACP5O2_12200 [Bacteroidales bacterium]